MGGVVQLARDDGRVVDGVEHAVGQHHQHTD